MKLHPVVICSNKVNRYGFRVLASGIKLDAYSKNPIVLYAHQRPSHQNPQITPVGKMHNIKLDATGQLVGEIEFDQDDDFAVKLEKKWEKGMLNAVSLKAEMLTVSDAPSLMLEGQQYPTLSESLLEEVSIEPVPGDSESVRIGLHYKGQPTQMISLSDDSTFDPTQLFPTKSQSDMKMIHLAFKGQNLVSLSADADEAKTAEGVSELAKIATDKTAKVVELSSQITAKDTEIATLKEQVKKVELSAQEEKATTLVADAVAAKKITPAEQAEYVELAKTNYDTVKKILENKKGFTSLTKETTETTVTIDAAKAKVYAELSYRQLGEKGLLENLKKDDPETFKAKFKEAYGVDYSGKL